VKLILPSKACYALHLPSTFALNQILLPITQVRALDGRLAVIERRIMEGGNESPGLASYLGEWWAKAIGRLKKEAPAETFVTKLVDWFESNK